MCFYYGKINLKNYKMKKSDIKNIYNFLGFSVGKSGTTHIDWNTVMSCVEKIESIIKTNNTIPSVEIRASVVGLNWWYSARKVVHFPDRSSYYRGVTQKREPFDAVCGSFYKIECYLPNGKVPDFVKKNPEFGRLIFAGKPEDGKLGCAVIVCSKFISWYNTTVLSRNNSRKTKKRSQKKQKP
jgi:hypothetical protein